MNKHEKQITLFKLTEEFVKFARIIGIYPKIHALFYIYCRCTYQKPMEYFFKKNSFYEYVKSMCIYQRLLNDGLISRIFLFNDYYHDKFKGSKDIIDLFFSYLHDKGYMRYIKLVV